MQGDELAFIFDSEEEALTAIARVEDEGLCFASGVRAIRDVWMVIFKLRGPNFIDQERSRVTNVVGEVPFEINLIASPKRAYSPV